MKTMAMKSWKRGAPVEMIELPDPTPSKHEVRVRVRAAGVNPVDWKMRTFGPLRLVSQIVNRPPVTVGIDFCGIVDAIGDGVTAFAIGDRVCGGTIFARRQRGSMADTVCVKDDQLVKVADNVSDDVAGALAVVGATAKLSLVDTGRLPAGGRVLVLGASGGVGQVVIGLARFLKDAEVIGVCSAKNLDLVRSKGCAHAIDYGDGDPLQKASELGPYDVIVDAAGGYDGFKCRAMLRPGGRHVLVAGEGIGAIISALTAPFTSRLVLGAPYAKNLQPVMDGLAASAFTIDIADTLPLEQLEEAHERSKTGRLIGKLVMKP